MDSLLPISTADFRSHSSFNNRSSPRARRDSPLLPTVDPPPKRPSSLFFTPSASFKSRKEVGRGSWLIRWPSTRRFLPWIALILVWFYIGFRLNIHWSDSSRPVPVVVGGRNESEISLPDEVTDQSSTESDEIWERAQGHGLAEEVDVARIDKESGVLENVEHEGEETGIDTTSTTSKREDHLGRDVGPFDALERQTLGALENPLRGCWKQSRFAKFVRTRSFVLVFHELSMTGAPLAMLELAREIVSCGGKASAVVLNKRGGLYKELGKRGVSVVRDKLTSSWKAAAASDLVVAGSAACNTWIEQYLRHNTKGGERLIWWMMENRREYFDRSKLLLGKAHALVFLSSAQEQLWRQWATEDALVVLPSMTKVVSLSIRDDLAASAGLDDESGTINSFLEAQKKRGMLRDLVRKEMGLLPSDYLVISLSSINPGKGQLLVLQAALMMTEDSIADEGLTSNLTQSVEASSDDPGEEMQLQEEEDKNTLDLKILLGSVGSKSNKPEYLEKIDELLDTYPSLAEMVLWTGATVHVAALYAAADAYVMNAQGIGETFGRVTVEAMAFGLPVLGTDAGGTKEIVQGNISGLLHPTGSTGIPVLAQNLQFLLTHPEIGVEMGKKGRARVQDMYREAPMYDAMASVFLDAVLRRDG